MQGCKCRSYELQYEKPEKKQQHINGTKNILLKGCTTTIIPNYNQKSGKPNRDAASNSLCSGRFLVCHVRSQKLHIFESWGIHSTEGSIASIKNLLTQPFFKLWGALL
ncbi:hypothetical protein TNCV_685691 [Trichonephila clavipes]|nr:hypothetical protein TNCV_685691 [Trichonephila clavipes]